MEQFLPGLVRVIEERLGRFGRPITTIVVIAVALGVFAWGVKLFIDNAVMPLSNLIKDIMDTNAITPEVVWRSIIGFVIYMALVIIFTLLARRFYFRKLFKSLTSTQRETEDLMKDVRDTHEETKALAKQVEGNLEEIKGVRSDAKQILADAESIARESNEGENEEQGEG